MNRLPAPRFPTVRSLLVPIIIGLFAWAPGCRANVATVPVTVLEVPAGDIKQRLTFSGEVKPIEESIVTPDIQGIVQRVRVENGQAVKSGGVLVDLEPERYAFAVHQAEAGLIQARQKVRETQKDYERVKILLAKKVINDKAYEVAETSFVMAQSSVKLAESALALAKLNLDRTAVRARLNGFFVNRNVFIGQAVSPGMSLGRVVDLGRVFVEARIPETEITEVRVGQPCLVAGQYPGQVAFVDLYADDARSFLVKLALDNPGQALKAKMFVKGEIVLAEHHGVAIIPAAAVVAESSGQDVVFIAVDGRARRIPVKIVARDGRECHAQGVEIGMKLIVAGQNQVADATPVQIMNVSGGMMAPVVATGSAR